MTVLLLPSVIVRGLVASRSFPRIVSVFPSGERVAVVESEEAEACWRREMGEAMVVVVCPMFGNWRPWK